MLIMNYILEKFKCLSSEEQIKLLKSLEANIGNETKLLSFRKQSHKPNCIHCQNEQVIKFGTYSNGNKARYRCTKCLKTFSDFTGTSVYNIKKKHLWMSFIKLMLENKTIRYIAKELNLSTATVFTWRHRVLSSFDKTLIRKFEDIVETDDIMFQFNQKGRRKDFKKITKKKRGVSNQKVSVMVTTDRYDA